MRRQTLWIVMSAVTVFLGTTATYADFVDDSQERWSHMFEQLKAYL